MSRMVIRVCVAMSALASAIRHTITTAGARAPTKTHAARGRLSRQCNPGALKKTPDADSRSGAPRPMKVGTTFSPCAMMLRPIARSNRPERHPSQHSGLPRALGTMSGHDRMGGR